MRKNNCNILRKRNVAVTKREFLSYYLKITMHKTHSGTQIAMQNNTKNSPKIATRIYTNNATQNSKFSVALLFYLLVIEYKI